MFESSEYFAYYFPLLTGGKKPFPWQCKLFANISGGEWPGSVALPTGAGKTSILQVWLIALGWSLGGPGRPSMPRRIAWVVNRRVVVDQATEDAKRIRARLDELSDDPLAESLKKCSPSGEGLAISTLRGERADNREWSRDPLRPAIVIGTVDMVGSRLLFRGYGDSRYRRPIHAGLLGVDTLIVNDESHLSPSFALLLKTIEGLSPGKSVRRPFRVLLVSATERTITGRHFEHNIEEDVASSERFRRVYEAEKRLFLHESPDNKSARGRMMDLAVEPGVKRTMVFVEQPEAALEFARSLEKKVGSGAVALLTGTMRGFERDALATSQVFTRFEQEPLPAESLFLVATSAGEVGVNISGERMVTMITESDRLQQRLGRLNRFGDQDDEPHRVGEAHVVYVTPKKGDNAAAVPQLRTLEYLRGLAASGQDWVDVSCQALSTGPRAPDDSRSPEPATARFESRLVDLWSQTTATGPAIPPVEPWLHGKQDSSFPETEIAWRAEVKCLAVEGVDKGDLEEALRRYRVLPRERLKEPTTRILRKLAEIVAEYPTHASDRVLFLDSEGAIECSSLGEVAVWDVDRLAYGLLLLPPGCGRLERGMFQPGEFGETLYDVADEQASIVPDLRRRRYKVSAEDGELTWEPLGSAGPEGQPAPSPGDRGGGQYAREFSYGTPVRVRVPGQEDSSTEKYVVFFPPAPAKNGDETGEVELQDHLDAVAELADRVARSAGLSELGPIFRSAGLQHDVGKAHRLWQLAMGGDVEKPKAKTTGRAIPAMLAGLRHELASVLRAETAIEGERDLILYLIGAHHGWGRSYWERKAYDRELSLCESERVSLEMVRRFDRLQRVWGPWGLAYLETLFKAADGLAENGRNE